MKRVLITGSNGFIGRHCLAGLIERGFEVHSVIRDKNTQIDLPEVQWNVADILNPDDIKSLFEKIRPSYLIHLAWYTAPGAYWTSSENLNWLQSSIEILRAFKLYGGQRILAIGTCAEYDWQFGYCSERVTPLAPSTLYSTCKNALHEVLTSFARQEGISAAWGRIFFLYGPYEHPTRLVPSIINSLLDGRPALCTHGNQIRDFLYVEDVASSLTALLDSEVEGAVNIASGKPVAVRDIIYRIAEKLGRPDLIQLGAISAPDSEVPLLVANVSRLHQEVGWAPHYDLDTGLEMTIDWWKRRKLL